MGIFDLFWGCLYPFCPCGGEGVRIRTSRLTVEGDTSWGERCRLRGARLGESAAPPVRYEALNYLTIRHIQVKYPVPLVQKVTLYTKCAFGGNLSTDLVRVLVAPQ